MPYAIVFLIMLILGLLINLVIDINMFIWTLGCVIALLLGPEDQDPQVKTK